MRVVFFAVFQFLIESEPALLKTRAPLNSPFMAVTLVVSQVPRFWLNFSAVLKVP
ncbi:unannotated protein [freshwater metagenome]|uniref:Unannotated protein n=1 Tax=freshwater metagenome TaxID=449393 RepID=A0A6J7K9Z4_9ZZZZ